VPSTVSKVAQNYAMQFGGTPASRAHVTVAAPQMVKDECDDLYG
jgi:hypothetical protein